MVAWTTLDPLLVVAIDVGARREVFGVLLEQEHAVDDGCEYLSLLPLQGNNGRIDKTCPNQDVIHYIKLTDFCHFEQITINSDIFCQHSVTLGNFLSIFCSLSRLD